MKDFLLAVFAVTLLIVIVQVLGEKFKQKNILILAAQAILVIAILTPVVALRGGDLLPSFEQLGALGRSQETILSDSKKNAEKIIQQSVEAYIYSKAQDAGITCYARCTVFEDVLKEVEVFYGKPPTSEQVNVMRRIIRDGLGLGDEYQIHHVEG